MRIFLTFFLFLFVHSIYLKIIFFVHSSIDTIKNKQFILKNLPIVFFFCRKGEEIQKLSVIQNLPNLLATDAQSCMSRVVPKMQQTLPTASTEFHIAASSTFKTILERKLISHTIFSQTFLQSILNSLESRDPGIIISFIKQRFISDPMYLGKK